MISKAELARLKARNTQYHTATQPTPSGVTMQQVDWQIEKARREDIARQEERLKQSGDVLYNNFTFKSAEGVVTASFNQSNASYGGQIKEVKPMSEQDNNQPQQSQEAAQPGKGNPPDQYAYRVSGEGKNATWEPIGAVWQGKDGYMSGTVNGERVVFQSREAKEALQKMREEKSAEQQQGQQQAQSQSKTPSQNPSM